MKTRYLVTGLLMTVALAGAASVYAADTSPTPPPEAWGPGAPGSHRMHGGRHMGGPMGMDGGFMHALHKLNLTDAQKQSVKGIIEGDRDQTRSLHESLRSNHMALATMTPDDPNYATALASAKNLSAQAIQHSADLRVQLYSVLTADQKKQLPQVFSDMQSEMQAHRDAWRSHHQAPTAPSNAT